MNRHTDIDISQVMRSVRHVKNETSLRIPAEIHECPLS